VTATRRAEHRQAARHYRAAHGPSFGEYQPGDFRGRIALLFCENPSSKLRAGAGPYCRRSRSRVTPVSRQCFLLAPRSGSQYGLSCSTACCAALTPDPLWSKMSTRFRPVIAPLLASRAAQSGQTGRGSLGGGRIRHRGGSPFPLCRNQVRKCIGFERKRRPARPDPPGPICSTPVPGTSTLPGVRYGNDSCADLRAMKLHCGASARGIPGLRRPAYWRYGPSDRTVILLLRGTWPWCSPGFGYAA